MAGRMYPSAVIGDGRDIEGGRELDVDLCIIGGGAAGIAIAQEFVDGPAHVILLESGGFDFETEVNDLDVGSITGLPYFPLEEARLRFFGGSTNHWGGYCRPFEPSDLAARAWVPGSGWPISRTDLDAYYPRARPIVGLPTEGRDPDDVISSDGARPLFGDSSRLVHVLAEIVPKTSRSFGVRYRSELEAAARVDVLLHSDAIEIETDDDGRRVERVHVATLAGNRFSVRPAVVVLATGGIENARLLLASDRLRTNGVGNDNDLVGRYFMDHPRFVAGSLVPTDDLHVRFYEPHDVGGHDFIGYLALTEAVLEAEEILEVQVRIGPIYTPAVQAALTSEDVDSLSDLVGQRPEALDALGEHVARVVADLATWQDGTVPGGPLAVPLPEVVAEVRERLLDGDFGELIPFLFGDIATVGYRDALGALPADSATLTTRIDPLPDPDSRVTLGAERDALGMRRAELHWELGQLDKWSAIRTLEILGEELGQAGVGRVRVGLHEDDDWPTDLAGGWHHMGTTRMSLDPSQGVVDPDCRVHGMDNLYIAGSSVFPTAGSGTPTMTIVALALRLADHLRERLA